MKTEGKHATADIWLNEWPIGIDLLNAAGDAIKKTGLTILQEVKHDFGTDALTGLWLLAESHFSLHTFPERNFISLDCYTCGNANPLLAVLSFVSVLDVASANMKIMSRG